MMIKKGMIVKTPRKIHKSRLLKLMNLCPTFSPSSLFLDYPSSDCVSVTLWMKIEKLKSRVASSKSLRTGLKTTQFFSHR